MEGERGEGERGEGRHLHLLFYKIVQQVKHHLVLGSLPLVLVPSMYVPGSTHQVPGMYHSRQPPPPPLPAVSWVRQMLEGSLRSSTVAHNCHSNSKLFTAQTKIFTAVTNNSQRKPKCSQRTYQALALFFDCAINVTLHISMRFCF